MNISGFDNDDIDGDQPVLDQCARELGVSSGFLVDGGFLMECLPKPLRAFSFADEEFISFYGIFGAEVVLLMIYWLYKRVRESVCLFCCPARHIASQ